MTNDRQLSSPVAHACAPQPPRWQTAESARQVLADELSRFLKAVAAGDTLETRTLAVRASAGIGKTRALLDCLGASAPALLANGHVQILMPTHNLAEEAHGEFRRLYPAVPSMVLRGRDAINPATDAPMCLKSGLARALGEIRGSVSDALCQIWDPQKQSMRRSLCRRACPWYEQIPAEPRVIFLAHAYLAAGMPVPGDIALRVIDEKFHANLLVTNRIAIENWLPRCDDKSGTTNPKTERLDGAREIVFRALRTGAPVNDSLRHAGYLRVEVAKFREQELASTPRIEIHPQMPARVQQVLVAGVDLLELRAVRARARVWQVIHQSWDRPSSERITLESWVDGSDRRYRIQVHRYDAINQGIPTILLDADANPLIVEAFRPGARFVSLDVRPNAEVIQVQDRTFSNASLSTGPKAADLRREVLNMVGREVARASGSVLLVATRDVLRQLHSDVDPAGDVSKDDALMRPLLGAHPRWFGPRLQGVNTYKDFDTVIILGRLEPPVAAIDAQMRALFGDGEVPLGYAARADGACRWFPKHRGWYLRPDGRFVPARVQHHPDPRGAVMLVQSREAHSLQAIARIRAVGSAVRKRILILSSIPLPAVPVTELMPWQELVTGVPANLAGKMVLLRQAIRRPDGALLTGLRLSVAGAAEDAAHAFPSKTAAAEWRRNLPTDVLQGLIRRVAAEQGLPITFTALRREGGGKPVPAVMLGPPERARDIAAKQWPGWSMG